MRVPGYSARMSTIDLAPVGASHLWVYLRPVTDPTGAAIPNATITVSDESKGTSVQATSNQSGEYTVPNLIPDVYDVKAEAAGFRAVENHGVQVAADTSPKVDLKLSVGNATESVTVTTEAPQLQTDRADVGTVFNQKTISGLPIAGRNFASLQLLIPGAQAMGWTQNNAEDSQGSPTVNIQGQFFAGVGYLLDGASNQDPILGWASKSSMPTKSRPVQSSCASIAEPMAASTFTKTKATTTTIRKAPMRSFPFAGMRPQRLFPSEIARDNIPACQRSVSLTSSGSPRVTAPANPSSPQLTKYFHTTDTTFR